MTIHLYSTDARKKVPLEPREPGRIRMYVCGPTVYDACHIGHARPAVVFDTIRRYLEARGYTVLFISNITDIDDKIIARAQSLGISCAELASRYQDEYERDMAALGVRSPTIRPKATEHIQEMIDLIATLMDKGFGYTTPRGVWFDVSKFDSYGQLSGRTTDDETTEHRVEQDPEKRNPQDFALWKFAKPGEPKWPSPWGEGRPGWHIECSAMAGTYAGGELDIHGGGADLAFPHHENERAQSEAATGRRFSRYWLHNGFITVPKENGEETKMGKSKGNAFLLSTAFSLAPPAALRLWILGTHYRAPLQYRPDLLQSAQAGLDRIYTCLENLNRRIEAAALPPPSMAECTSSPLLEIEKAVASFHSAMEDDFNTAQALAAVYELVGVANRILESDLPQAIRPAYDTIHRLLAILGLPLTRPQSGSGDLDAYLRFFVTLRHEARKEKNYVLADRIRAGLASLGIELNDRGEETTWRRR